jgi:outer membrane immunogenic protein
MRRIQSAVLATVAVVGLASVAFADGADSKYRAPAAVSAPTWTGFYAGANVGWESVKSGAWTGGPADPNTAGVFGPASFLCPAVGPGICPNNSPGSATAGGWEGGFQVGYNYQMGPTWVVGLETDLQGSNATAGSTAFGTNSLPAGAFLGGAPGSGQPYTRGQTDINWFGTVRARLGWLATQTTLLYGTGGYAYGRVHQGMSGALFPGQVAAFQGGIAGDASKISSGWTLGFGAEQMIPGTKFTIGLEYLYVRLDSAGGFTAVARTTGCGPGANFTVGGAGVAGATPCSWAIQPGKVDDQVVRAKLSLKF